MTREHIVDIDNYNSEENFYSIHIYVQREMTSTLGWYRYYPLKNKLYDATINLDNLKELSFDRSLVKYVVQYCK